MSRRLFFAASVAALAVLGCNDRDAGPTAPASSDPTQQITSAEDIDALLESLFRPGDQLRSVTSFFNYIKTKVRQERYADAQARVVVLSQFTMDQLAAGKLLDPNGEAAPSQELQIASLFCELTNYARDPGTTAELDCADHLADAGAVETGGGTIGFVGPAGGTVTTPEGWGGIQLPPGAVNQFVTLTILPIAPNFPPLDGPLNTELDQYPLFFNFSVFPAGLAGEGEDFAEAAIVGMCQLDVGDGPFAPPTTEVEARLQIAHNIGEEGFEILEKVYAPFLTCGDLTSEDPQFPPPGPVINAVPASGDGGLASFASAGWQRVTGVMSPVFDALLPTPAHAAVLGGCCLGGLATKLSPFGAVDPESNNEVEQLGFATPTSVSTGFPFTVTVTARDGAGVIVDDADGMVSLSLVGGADVCTLSGTTSQPFVDGSATFTDLVISDCGGGQAVTLGGVFGEVSGESGQFVVQNPIL